MYESLVRSEHFCNRGLVADLRKVVGLDYAQRGGPLAR
jgi:hypothetical protein